MRQPKLSGRRIPAARSRRGALLIWPTLAAALVALSYAAFLQNRAELDARARLDARVETIGRLGRQFEYLVAARADNPADLWSAVAPETGILLGGPPIELASGIEPAAWFDGNPAHLGEDVELEFLIGRATGWERATGIMIVRAPDDMPTVTLRRMAERLATGDTDSSGITEPAEAVAELVLGRTLTDREIAVYAFRYLDLGEEFVLRDTWIGVPQRGLEADLDLHGNVLTDVGGLSASMVEQAGSGGTAIETAELTLTSVAGTATTNAVTAETIEATAPGSVTRLDGPMVLDWFGAGVLNADSLDVTGASVTTAGGGPASPVNPLASGLRAGDVTISGAVDSVTLLLSDRADITTVESAWAIAPESSFVSVEALMLSTDQLFSDGVFNSNGIMKVGPGLCQGC
ncbi:hypothetical protein [Roseobacter sp. HKCCA0434]|uniref:hypothetical protein n=1 Tax=Roseobacter sp. HKCCA0434 TaxID=3079297 RepID=UPI00290588EE|nr:hypothetical protein [Roseobacter sp. HKCCA0434]